jgi:hypothetical protein
MAKAQKTKPVKASKGTLTWPLRSAVFLMLICAAIFAPATVIFFVCMMPTFVAALIDKQPQKTLWLTVGSMNLAGTVPAWFRLWEAGGGMGESIEIISNPSVLLVAMGSAAAGWLIHMNVTPLVATLVVRRNEGRLRDIDKQQRELVRKWGDAVARSEL